MAKATVSKVLKRRIPEGLARHIQLQQDRATVVAVLLSAVRESIEHIDGTGDCTLALRHVGQLQDELALALDIVNVSKAAGVAS